MNRQPLPPCHAPLTEVFLVNICPLSPSKGYMRGLGRHLRVETGGKEVAWVSRKAVYYERKGPEDGVEARAQRIPQEDAMFRVTCGPGKHFLL